MEVVKPTLNNAASNLDVLSINITNLKRHIAQWGRSDNFVQATLLVQESLQQSTSDTQVYIKINFYCHS